MTDVDLSIDQFIETVKNRRPKTASGGYNMATVGRLLNGDLPILCHLVFCYERMLDNIEVMLNSSPGEVTKAELMHFVTEQRLELKGSLSKKDFARWGEFYQPQTEKLMQ